MKKGQCVGKRKRLVAKSSTASRPSCASSWRRRRVSGAPGPAQDNRPRSLNSIRILARSVTSRSWAWSARRPPWV